MLFDLSDIGLVPYQELLAIKKYSLLGLSIYLMIRPNSEDKILDLCLRVEKLEADNSGLRLLVKDLMFEV